MAFIKYKVANLAQAPILAGITNSAVSVSVTSGRGALFPAVPFLAKIEEFDIDNVCIKREIVKVTAKADDLFTIVRSFGYCPASDTAYTQTNTALAFSAGAILSHTLTAEQLDDIQTEVERLEDDKLDSVGTLRTELTAKRVLITDASGNETQLSGTNGQVVGFDADGDPIATTPSVDIAGLPASLTIEDTDSFIKFDSSATENKELTFAQLYAEILSRVLTETVPFLASGTTSGAGTLTFAHGLGRIPRKISVSAHGTASDRTGLTRSTGAYNGTAYACSFGYDSGIDSEWWGVSSSSSAVAVIIANDNGGSSPDQSVWTVTAFDDTNVTLTKTISNTDPWTIAYSLEIE